MEKKGKTNGNGLQKSFEKWKFSELHKTFGLKDAEKHPLLEGWLAQSPHLSDAEKSTLENLRRKLREYVNAWQEEELKAIFIIPLLEIMEFRRRGLYTTFMDRSLDASVKTSDGKEILLKGKMDWVVAAGLQDPEEPFFFVHEYKPQSGPNNDPLGQLLAAMLVAREKNPSGMPLYGLYVIGRLWFFVALQGDEYAVSLAFDATTDDIFAIAAALKVRKTDIEQRFLG